MLPPDTMRALTSAPVGGGERSGAPARRAVRALLGGGLHLALAAGCGEVLGAGDYREAPAAPPRDAGVEASPTRCGGFDHAEPACATCTDTYCCTAADECSRDPDCRLVTACRAACGHDETCQSGCSLKVPRSVKSNTAAD